MTEGEAIAKAKNVAQELGWRWREPVILRRRRQWLVAGPLRWQIVTSADRIGGNIRLIIDDATGEVVAAGFAPR